MKKLIKGAKEVVDFLKEKNIPYFIIGGLATQQWGEPRTTHDIDITVLVDPRDLEIFLDSVFERFAPRIADARNFALKNRVLLVKTKGGIPVDISLGIPGYEEVALKRAKPIDFPNVGTINLISPEDLIIHKCVAGRPRDIEDVVSILIRQRLKLETKYIKKWLRAFQEVVESHNPLELFESALKEAKERMEGNKYR